MVCCPKICENLWGLNLIGCEVLLLWEDPFNGAVRGRCLFTMPHPEVPKLEEAMEAHGST